MKITAKNIAVGTSAEDIILQGGTFTEPTTERIHAIVSSSTADDDTGIPQVETATVAGTVDGTLQVETATVAGTIGAAGAGNVSVVVTGALVTGSPLTVPVAVANDDTAAQVAGKIRTALGLLAAITDNYTVGGSSATVTLTTKAKAANDTTLNIATSTGTATGLTAAPTSANTTAGHAGSGNVAVVVTGALVTGSPLTVNVPVVITDTAALVAGKIRTALGALAAITDNYTVGGSTTAVILTAKVGAANDATLNIAVADGTSQGVTTAATSTNTTAGVAPTGARSVEILGYNNAGVSQGETVYLEGTTPVNTVKSYLFINSMKVKKVGTLGHNVGTITATAATDGTVTCTIVAEKNNTQMAAYMSNNGNIKNINITAKNATADAITYVDMLSKKKGEPWITEMSIQLTAENPEFKQSEVLFQFPGNTRLFKIMATASAGSSSVAVSFEAV